MKFDAIQSNFTSGELSPQLQSRVDLEAFKTGVSICENMVVQPHGGLNFRGGFHYVDTVKNSAKKPILIEFDYKSEYSYILEFGENYIRFYISHAQILSASVAYEVTTTYLHSELRELCFSQDSEAMYITHPKHFPAKLTRTAHNSWTLADIDFNFSDSDIWQRYDMTHTQSDVYSNRNNRSICWCPKLNIFVAVSDSLTEQLWQTMQSEDGVSWSNYSAAANYDWTSISWSPTLELFVAVAESGGTTDRFMYSSDAETWTLGSMPAITTVPTYTSVCWCPKYAMFYAIADGGSERIANTANGSTWETFNYIDLNSTWESICWSPALEYFVAVASSGTNRLGTSSNAHVWYFQTVPANEWKSVCWSPELEIFVAVSEGLETNSVVTSDDLINWTERTPGFEEAWQSVCWSEEIGVFVAVAKAGGSLYKRIMTSPDGINWVQHASQDRNFSSVCHGTGAGVFVAVNDTSATQTSIDGKSWDHPSENNDMSVNSVCWGNTANLFIAVASGGNGYRFLVRSTDGRIWASQQVLVKNDWDAVCWGSTLPLFVAVASTGNNDRVATSPDGLTWSIQDASEENSWRAICWSPSLAIYVAVSSDGTNRVMLSSDGVTWTAHSAAAANSWVSICWSAERALFVAVSTDGANRVMYSVDGANWSSTPAAEDNEWRSVCWSAEVGLFVAVSYTGTNKVMTSPTGFVWESRSIPTIDKLTAVCWSADIGIFVAVSGEEEPRVIVSSDGIEWTYRIAVDGYDWTDVCWSSEAGLFVAVSGGVASGTRASAMTSPRGGGIEDYWEEDDYPAINWFYEQRHFFAATPNDPNKIWGSKTASYADMALGTGLDNEGISFTYKSVAKFLWAAVGREMILGGSNVEVLLGANSSEEAITPSNVRPIVLTNYGSAKKRPVIMGDNVIFLQRGGRKLRKMSPSEAVTSNYGSFKAIDLTLLSNHITMDGINNFAEAFTPHQTIWVARTDGTLIGLTYEEEHKIFGWHRHELGGANTKVDNVATAHASENSVQDEIWAIVERTINGATVSHIEYMVEGLSDEQDIEDSFFVDSGITKIGSAFTSVTGLDHLEGEEVTILGDGVPQDSKTVSSGSITLDTAVDKVHVGLGYEALVKTMPIEGGNEKMGTSQGVIKRIDRVSLRLNRSLDFKIGDIDNVFDEYVFESTSLFTGDTDPMPFTGSFDRQSCLQITHDTPLPFNLLAIMYEARTR